MILKSNRLTKQPTISATKLIGYIEQDTENFFGNVDRLYILQFRFISFWRNTLCLKNSPYNQVVLKMILMQSRLFVKKTQPYLYRSSLGNWNLEEYIFVNKRFYV